MRYRGENTQKINLLLDTRRENKTSRTENKSEEGRSTAYSLQKHQHINIVRIHRRRITNNIYILHFLLLISSKSIFIAPCAVAIKY